MDFHEQYSTFTDERILEILKNHKDYQELAVDAAVEIAIERGLIYSKQDLLAPEYQISTTPKLRLFPVLSSDFAHQKLIGSIFRFIFILSFMPVIYGFLSYGKGELNQAYLDAGVALTWFALSFLLKKTRKLILFIPLFFELLSVSVAVGLRIFGTGSFRILDLVVLVIGTLLPIYMLTYLKILLQR